MSVDVTESDYRFLPRRNRSLTLKERQGRAVKRNIAANNLAKRTTSFDEYSDYMLKDMNEIVLGTSDYRDQFVTKFTQKMLDAGETFIMEQLCVIGSQKDGLDYIKKCVADGKAYAFSCGIYRHILVYETSIVEIDSSSNSIEINLHGSPEINAINREKLLAIFDEIVVRINWIYDQHMNSATIPIDSTRLPLSEMYPFLKGESLESYYHRYLKSDASILILIGPPGTGKTSFIRGFLAATHQSALVTYDSKILSNDGLFSQFISDNNNVLVIEDADLFLSSRKDGNEMMHKFLNVGDGLVTVKGKKMIFSTNLPSIRDIDDALLRRGRCFDVLTFDELDREDASRLIEKLGPGYELEKDKHRFTIADIFDQTRNETHKKPGGGFGFCG